MKACDRASLLASYWHGRGQLQHASPYGLADPESIVAISSCSCVNYDK